MNTKESKETANKRVVAIQSGQNIELCQLEDKDSFANEICNEIAGLVCTSPNNCNVVIIGDVGIGTTVVAQNLLRVIAEKLHGNVEKVNNELFFGKSLELAEAYSLTNAGLHITFLIPNANKCIRLQIAHNVKDFGSCKEAYNFFKGADHVICLELEAEHMYVHNDVIAFQLSKLTFDQKTLDTKPVDKKTK